MDKKSYLWAGVCALSLFCTHTLQAVDVFVEAKAGYFRPTDPAFRKIYSSAAGGGGIYGGEINCQVWKDLYAWGSGSYFHKTGSSIGGNDATSITFAPLGLGLKYLFPVNIVDLYLGAGVLGTYVHLRDHSPYVIPSITRWGVGGIIKGGALINITKHLFIDLFSDYSFNTIGFHNTDNGKVVPHSINLSGWSIGGGVGIGYRFGGGKDKSKFLPP